MKSLGVIKEDDVLETRVALTPEVVKKICSEKLFSVAIEKGAGLSAGFDDDDYLNAGATIESEREEIVKKSQLIACVNGLFDACGQSLSDKVIIGLFDPFFHKDKIATLCSENASLLSLELIPRISRAQSMDALSSQANIAGYQSVLVAAVKLNKILPLMMTAAGTIKPAKVLIIGAGVAGLSAIATAKRLGAVVYSYDVRAAAKEQAESLGAKFINIKIDESGEGQGGYAKALSLEAQTAQRKALAAFAKDCDIVISTAQIPGRVAPRLLDKSIFSQIKRDAVLIDMASTSGGNIEGSQSNQWQRIENAFVYGADNLARMAPKDASFAYGKNIYSLLQLMFKEDGSLNLSDEIIEGALLCHQKNWVNPSFKKSIEQN